VNKYNLNLLFLGGDKRQEHIYNKLKIKYKNSFITAKNGEGTDNQKLRNADILIFPTIASTDNYTLNTSDAKDKVLVEDILKNAINCRGIIAGKISDKLIRDADKYDISCLQYVDSEAFKILNAIPTAEGAVSIAVNNTDRTLWGSRCLIIGNGCIGKTLARLLNAYSADVVISARKERDFADIESKGMKWIHTERVNDRLDDYDIIINTVPYRILKQEAIAKLSGEKLIIDLASKPYGLDHSLNENYKCKVILGSSLPGIYSPVTAAEIAATAIEQLINEVVGDE